jgi:hypothetical protein
MQHQRRRDTLLTLGGHRYPNNVSWPRNPSHRDRIPPIQVLATRVKWGLSKKRGGVVTTNNKNNDINNNNNNDNNDNDHRKPNTTDSHGRRAHPLRRISDTDTKIAMTNQNRS